MLEVESPSWLRQSDWPACGARHPRHPGCSRVDGRLRREAPSHLSTVTLWAPEQSYGRVAPAVHPSSLSEALP